MAHEMLFTLNAGRVEGDMVCTEPPSAKCRWKVAEGQQCDCETYYNMDEDAQGPFHTCSDPPDELDFTDREQVEAWLDSKHRMEYGGECNIKTWLDQDDDAADSYAGGREVIGRREIQTTWTGDQYEWTIKP